MCDQYTTQQICLMNRIRQLWGRHVYWTRFFIISTASNLNDLEPVTKKLLKNPKDFARVLTPIYGIKAAGRFEELFTQHLLIAADLVNAAKSGQIGKANAARDSWHKNADEIAEFLSSVNPCCDKAKWKNMFPIISDFLQKIIMLYLCALRH